MVGGSLSGGGAENSGCRGEDDGVDGDESDGQEGMIDGGYVVGTKPRITQTSKRFEFRVIGLVTKETLKGTFIRQNGSGKPIDKKSGKFSTVTCEMTHDITVLAKRIVSVVATARGWGTEPLRSIVGARPLRPIVAIARREP
ncbi:hypothetical protein L6452_01654 [Arctium lappa]|uniref:Uncharacterized protein n=1 Tax=Arctium lappa TaxID=4217 RepID=A0ACB9FHW7_ARCLA|nr:hypothetical protein L6452_01654 [Arctium lappa]